MNPKITAEVKLYGKKMLVLSALTLTIAPLVAVGNQRGMTARADSTGSGSQTNGLKVKVDDKALQTAVTQAKAAGVNVTQKATKNTVATSGQATQAQKDIAADYNNQAAALAKVTATQKAAMDKYNTAEAQYQKDLAAWEAYMKDPEYTNSTQWSKQTLQDLIGNNPANVTYVSNSTNKMSLDYGNVSKMTAAQFKTFLETYKGGSTISSVDNKNGTWVVLKVGSTFTYQSPFVDVSTGKPVDVKFTVDKLDNQKTPAYAYLSKYAMGANLATPNLYGHYKVNFYDHDSGKPVTLKEALIGMGDLDASQYVTFDGQAVKTIYGDKVTKVNDDSYKAHDDTAYDDAETGTQVWRRLDNVSGFSYTWGQAIDHWSAPYQSDDYFAVGNIDFAIKLKPKPVAPTKPKAETASYQLTDLTVTPSNHKDVTAGDNQDKDGASINGKTVDKGDTLTYPLTNSDLPANRTDDIKSYVMTDKVQKELTVNQAETVKANTKNWDVKVDSQTVIYTAKADLLKAMNADKPKAYAVPEAKLVTTVNTDNVTVKNQFNTKINDVTTDSNTPSNPVEKLSPSLVAKRVEDAQGKFKTTSDNVNILTGKDVYFDIFNQYDNNAHTNDLTDTDQLPKDAKVDLKDVKVYLADTATSDTNSSSKADDESAGAMSASSAAKTDDQSSSTTSTSSVAKADDQSSSATSASSSAKADDQSGSTSKIDAKTMTKEKLATLTYTKDVTADFTVKFENGKLTVTPKADKAAAYAGKQTKTRFTASLPTDKADSELTKQGQTYTWNNQAANGKDKTNTVNYHTDKPATPAKPKNPVTPTPKTTVTKAFKMAQTGHQQTWFDKLVAWFK